MGSNSTKKIPGIVRAGPGIKFSQLCAGKTKSLPHTERKDMNKNYKVKFMRVRRNIDLSDFPNFHRTGSITGMKKLYYGRNALLVRKGNYIYNVSSEPDIYFNL